MGICHPDRLAAPSVQATVHTRAAAGLFSRPVRLAAPSVSPSLFISTVVVCSAGGIIHKGSGGVLVGLYSVSKNEKKKEKKEKKIRKKGGRRELNLK